jgi:hypothetical protein
MRYVTPKQSKALSALILAALMSSCSLKSNGQSQTLTIALPGANVAQNSILKSMTEWISLTWASITTATNLNNDPSALSDFDCFAVNVNGPGINLDPNVTCSDPADAPAIFGGFVPNGNSSIDLDVPAGPGRVIKIMGVRSLIGCPNFHDMVTNGAIDFKSIGHFYEIGNTRQDIYNDATVTINATYNSASPTRAFSQCKSNNEDNGSHLWGVYAGTGPGTINASKTIGGSTYVTGKFDYIGPDTHSGVMLSQTTGSLATSEYAHINGTVKCATPDGAGGYYVGGAFSGIESTSFTSSTPYQANVLHIFYNGTWDTNFIIQANVGGTINACVRDGNHLYVGGSFTSLSYSGTNVSATALADISLNSVGVTDLGSLATFSANPTINALALGSSRLYAGGSFTFQSIYQNALAINLSVSPATLDTSWHPQPNSTVNTLYHDSVSSVYLGGTFTAAGGQSRYHLARVDSANTGSADTWNPTGTIVSASSNATSVLSNGAFVYGAMASSGAPKVVRLDSATGATETAVFTANTADSINTIALSPSVTPTLYIGGNFKSAAGSPQQGMVAYENIATTPTLVSSSIFSANINTGSSVYAIVPDLVGKLFVGGDFDSIGGVLRNNIAAFNLLSGTPTSWNPTGFSTGEGTSIASDGSSIYVGYKGDSIHLIYGGIAKISTDASATLLSTAATSTYTQNIFTVALSSDNSSLYVGGQFSTLAGAGSLTGLARLHASDLTYDSNWTSAISGGNVNTILVNGDVVYVGGSFSQAGPSVGSVTTHPGLVAFYSSSSSIVTGWIVNSALAQGVQAITLLPSGDLAVATQTVAGSGPALIKRISATAGSSLTWPNGQSSLTPAMTQAKAMIAAGGALYVGGLASSTSERTLVSYDLITDAQVLGFDPHFYNNFGTNSVNSLEAPVAGILLIGGQFSQANVEDNAGHGGKEAWGLGVINANTGVYY